MSKKFEIKADKEDGKAITKWLNNLSPTAKELEEKAKDEERFNKNNNPKNDRTK